MQLRRREACYDDHIHDVDPEELLDTLGVITAEQAGAWKSTLIRRARGGDVVRVYPGVYAARDRRLEPDVRIRAAIATNPGGCLLGRAALWAVAGWELGHAPVVMSGQWSRVWDDLIIRRVAVPPDWSVAQGAVTACLPAFAVTDLAAEDRGAAIDRFLREGGDLQEVRSALEAMKHWDGTLQRRRVVHASRALPWSPPERLLHDILFEARINGWLANYAVVVAGRTYYADVAFPRVRLILEVDGYAYHSSPAAFEADRERQNVLVNAGWRILRFTSRSLEDRDAVVSQIRDAISLRS